MERFADEVGHPLDLHQDGYLFLLSTPQSVELFKANIEMQRRLRVDVELLTPDDAVRLAPGLDVDGTLAASYCARDGIADPNSVTMGFVKAAQAAGGRIERESEVTAIAVSGGRVTGVETGAGPSDLTPLNRSRSRERSSGQEGASDAEKALHAGANHHQVTPGRR